MAFFDKAFSIAQGEVIQPLLVRFAKVDRYLFHGGENDQQIGIDHLRQLRTGPILVDNRTGAAQMVTLANHRNTAAADCDHHVAVIHQRFYRLFLNNIDRFRRRDDATVAATGVLFHGVAVLGQLLSLFFAEE